MEILITSKTHKGKAACVGGLVLNDNRYVRLLNPGNWDQYADTDFEIGEIWEINFEDREDIEAPLIEDIIIQSQTYLRDEPNIADYISNCGLTIYSGDPSSVFEGRLGWTGSGAGYIGNRDDLPVNSVGFWRSDKDLSLEEDGKHYQYSSNCPFIRNKRFPYVGFEPTVDIIPAGTLLRVSLARWWKPEDSEMDERCYLQLSGWYRL